MKRWDLKVWTPKPVLKLGAFYAVLALVTGSVAAAAVAKDISPERKNELRYVLEQDCGSCHGLTLKGGLGSPLLAGQLTDRDAADLASVILDGVPGTPMPPWRPLIQPHEALWLAQILKSGDLGQ
jgi:cytochrome c55X